MPLSHFVDVTHTESYKQALITQGSKNNWQLGPWLEFADDHAIGQSYLWAVVNGIDKKNSLNSYESTL